MDERLIQQQEQELAKTGRYYLHVCFMTIPLLCMACFLYGLRPLLLCGAALLTGNLCDRLVSLLRRRVYRAGDFSNESFALIIALLMPATVDLYVVIMAVLAGVLIGKEVFGGYGSYPFNPAAVGYAVAAVSWPEQVFRYPQPYINIPLWDATGVPVSSTISDTLRSGGSLNISAISLGLGEYAAPMGTGAALILLACGLFLWLQKDVRLGASVSFVVTCALIAFLFTTVAANAIAIVGSNPVSGMTLMTLILASVVMVGVGLKGTGGMLAALIMGGVVCTALSMSGSFITDLKIGYWLGTTPKKQETWKFLGTLVSAATVGGVMMLLNETYGFASGQLAAPQANAMAAVIDPLMSGVGAPWVLYGIGALIAIVLTLCNVPALAFALGMFIPMELNIPLLVGGAVNWYVTSRTKDAKANAERGEKGNLLASGFIAGGALMGVVSALLRFCGVSFDYSAWWANPLSQVCALVAYVLLIAYFIRATKPSRA